MLSARKNDRYLLSGSAGVVGRCLLGSHTSRKEGWRELARREQYITKCDQGYNKARQGAAVLELAVGLTLPDPPACPFWPS